MRIMPVNLLDDSVSFRSVCGLCQSWRNRDTYGGYMTAPRQHHGLFEIRCREVVITDAAGADLRCRCGDVVYLPKGAVYKTTFLSDTDTAETLLVNFDIQSPGGDVFFAGGICKLTALAPPAATDDEFLEVSGVGAAKLARYGEAFLSEIAAYGRERGIEGE